MTTYETRYHLGPHEVEVDSPLYGIMLVPSNGTNPVMTLRIFDSLEKAMKHADTFDSRAYVVTIKGTHSE